MNDLSTWGIVMGLTSAFTWALSSFLFDRIFRNTPPQTRPSAAGANLFKNSLALGVFALGWLLWSEAAPSGEDFRGLLLSGFLGFALADTFFFVAIGLCGVQLAAMIGLLNVPVATLLSWALLGERPTATVVASMGIVLTGVILVILDQREQAHHDAKQRRLGVMFAVANAIVLAYSVVKGHESGGHVATSVATTVRLLGGVVGAFLVAVIWGLQRKRNPVAEVRELTRPYRTRSLWKSRAIASLFGSVLGLFPYHEALRLLPGGVSALTFACTPLFLLPIGLATGDRPGWKTIVGTLIGLVGVAGVLDLKF